MVRKKNIVVKSNSSNFRRNKSKVNKPKSISLNTKRSEDLFIGKILVGTTINFPPEKWLECRLSFLCAPEEVDRIHIQFDEISVIVTLIVDTEILKEIITANAFTFGFSLIGEDLFLEIYFKELPLPSFTTKKGNALKTIFTITHNISLQEEDRGTCVKVKIEDVNFQDVQHSCLKPELRPYQRDAIKWMLNRETVEAQTVSELLHPLYVPVKLPSGLEIYFDKYSGYVTPTKPIVTSSCAGGILAEDMGLGKTVEFLALILNHPYIPTEMEHDGDEELSLSNQDSDSEISDNNDADYPIITQQSKKRFHGKKAKLSADKNSEFEDVVKDIKVPSDWVKSSSKKSSTYIALQLWYNSALSEVNNKPMRQKEIIQCICGETYTKGKIQCIDCGKFQHEECLGFQKRFKQFRCPSCWQHHPLIESGATLIVTPTSLRTQWCNEIKMHLNKRLRVLIYKGSNKNPIYPTYLTEFDIVITTYSVLQHEFRLSKKGQEYGLRRKRRYDYLGSPLSTIKWWRLCLDEAQTVETPSRIVSAMARKLTAQYRWAVTGTPVSKELSDLHGLIDYLLFEPYNDLETWTNLIQNPYLNGNPEPLRSLLSKIIWRSCKADVINQINIPKQSIVQHSLEFSAVEKFFYNKEHELSYKGTLKKIMLPLLSLRQACTHPNTVRGRYLATRKQVSTMKELLEALILKNSTESEEHLRLVVSSLNGLAGIYLLMQNPVEAAAQYRKVMQLAARFSEGKTEYNLTVDKLQLIHTMHNLADLIEANKNIPPTLHDSTLRSDCNKLEQKYIEKFTSNSLAAYEDSNNAQLATSNFQEQFILKEGQWYSDGLDWVIMKNLTEEFFNRIRNNHDTAQVKCPIEDQLFFQISRTVACERTILLFVSKWDEQVTNYRADTINEINRLFTNKKDGNYKIIVEQKVVELATDCHLRPEQKTSGKKFKCPLCKANDNLKNYECQLFNMTKRTVTYEEMSLQGSWKATSQELILRALNTVLRAKNAPDPLIKDAEIHMSILDNLKKEFKEIRKLWTHIYQQVAAQDELAMSKIRLRLEDPDSKTSNKNSKALKRLSYILENKLDTVYMLNEHELDYHMMLLKSDESKGSAQLEKSLGICSYLETLRKQQYEGQSPDPCPICRNVLDQHWSILTCGHNFCMECIHKLLEQTSSINIICCVCRQPQPVQDISYIRSGPIKNESDDVDIKGNFSTKMESIIKLLMELKSEDEHVKVLVFSSWLKVLKLLKDALMLNDIKTEILLSFKLEERIENFKVGIGKFFYAVVLRESRLTLSIFQWLLDNCKNFQKKRLLF
ncbi:hypothetical protein HHI36_012714 [Cryptolaemus montrouzieri]|uniref:RING-type domain-containing protein n=1 Tax=Cryptolaemus montrouzieri TaxID=559131 RepID=A0ABD2NFH5_9CUCU